MGELKGKGNKKEKFVDKSVHQTYRDSKPVGYGSSIQNSGNGNQTRPDEHKIDGLTIKQNSKEA